MYKLTSEQSSPALPTSNEPTPTSIWPSILIHAVNNSLKFILVYALLATSMKLPLL
jgi:hypothetical protein